MTESYFLFETAEPKDSIGAWGGLANGYDVVIGYSWLGDVFLRERANSGRFGTLFTVDPEFVPLLIDTASGFREYLSSEVIERTVLKVSIVERIVSLNRPLVLGEVFIPRPFAFLGGDGLPETYGICKISTLLEMLGQLQGVFD